LARFPQAVALQNNRPCALVRSTNHSVHPAPAQHLLDSGHFALEDKGDDIATLMLDFLDRKLPHNRHKGQSSSEDRH
jgi:hypothetical protein